MNNDSTPRRSNRRRFLQTSAAGAAAALGLPLLAGARALGANDEIRIAIIGCGIRGGAHIAAFGPQKGVRIAAVCDPDRQRMEAAARTIETRFKYRPAQVVDVRQVMDRKDIDAVAVATMQYWHALPTIWACQTGRHVYVEKPLAHFIWEGRQMVNAARKYNRLVQVGTQNRSLRGYAALARWLRQGNLGKIQYVTCFANKSRRSIGRRKEPLPIPETVDYELWCGPARKEPIYRDRLQYDCSFIWNMGDGESCNQGVHEVDIARWILGYTGLPRRTMSIGGRFIFNDAGEVPNTQIIYYDYPEVPILYEIHNLPRSKEFLTPQRWSNVPDFRGARVGVCVQCEGGYTLGPRAFDRAGKQIQSFGGSEDHFANFIRAVRSGRRADLNADILEGHLSTNICHAGNISYRLGRAAPVAEQRRQAAGIPCWEAMHDRFLRYLGEIGVDPNTAVLGPWLECDPANECFRNHPQANALVRGYYRKGFEVPEIKT